MALFTNAELWNKLRAAVPQFKAHTAEATDAFFTEQGWEQLKNFSINQLNDWFELSMRVFLDTVNISDAKDPLSNFGETRSRDHGFYIQRLAVESVKPISPSYKNLTNGASIDPFVIRKPVSNERFFQTNFDYQSLITIVDEYQMKTIFISQYGMSEFMAGIMKGLENGWTIQRYVNKLEAINKGINSTDFPLQDTQKVTVTLGDATGAAPSADQLRDFIVAINDTITAMTISAQSSAFNASYYKSTQDTSRLRLLVRAGYKNLINAVLLAGAFNPEKMAMNLDPASIIEVEHFGGLKPYKDADYTIPLYPVYDTLGAQIGWNEAQGQATSTVDDADVKWKDPNASVVAILADKGWLFESIQNGYKVEPIRNPRGLYTNYWASCPNNAIGIDSLYNAVVFQKSQV